MTTEIPPEPLFEFFQWLADEHGWRVDLSLRRRIALVLHYESEWTLGGLQNVLAACLAHEPDQFARLQRYLRDYFLLPPCPELRPQVLDRAALLADLRQLAGSAAPCAGAENVVRAVSGDGAEDPPLRPPESPGTAPPLCARLRETPWPPELPTVAPRRQPAQQPAILSWDWADPDKPRQFFLADVGGPPPALLESAVLDQIADSMGYFQSPIPSQRLNIEASVRETIARRCPALQFWPGRQVCQLLILEDTYAESRAWNSVARELATGMVARGVPATYGVFEGVPERFRAADGSAVCHLEDWEDQRQGLLLLLFTEGQGFFPHPRRRLLDDLATWPKVAWMDLREPEFWDSDPRLARERGIPVFPATATGLLEMTRLFLTEGETRSRAWPSLALPDPRLDVGERVVGILREALPWAERCAVLPSIPRALADALRRRFCPQVDPAALGRMFALPGSEHDSEGLHLAPDVRAFLVARFKTLRADHEQQAVARFVREQIETASAKLQIPPDSLAAHSREGILLRVDLIAGGVPTRAQTELLRREAFPFAGALCVQLRTDASLLDGCGQLTDEQSRQLERMGLIPPRPSPYPDDLVRIPAGTFLMGDPTAEGAGDERPRHPVEVSTFYIARHPVTWELWQEVYGWAVEHGYQFDNRGAGRGPKHPVTNVSWYDAVKWCNARSEMEGRRPAYFTDASRTEPYRQGQLDLPSDAVEWTASGYRLPTEAEWEKAARGGLEGHHYPWKSQGRGCERFISPQKANYDKSNKSGTTPVDTYSRNGYGLFDMAGNVWEWSWDRWDGAWYGKPDATTGDTRGPTGGVDRVFRGGGWWYSAWYLRCACRDYWHPSDALGNRGFRLAGGQAEAKPAKLDEGGERGSRDETPSEPPESSGADQACLTVELVPYRAVAGLRPSHEERPKVSSSPGDLTVGGAAGSGDPRRARGAGDPHRARGPRRATSEDNVRLTFGESGRDVAIGEPIVLDAGQCRLMATRRFCWPATTSHELEPGKAYHLRILMQRQPPPGMVEIPAGPFQMGDPTNEGDNDERPKHDVFVDAFFMAQRQVTWALWREVYDWAVEHDYQFENRGDGFGNDHPVHGVNWYDVAKWCNACSEREGRDPAYFEDRIGGRVYRQGDVNLLAAAVDWNGEGFRLPTEAEWEKAARGGAEGQHYPWESLGHKDQGAIRTDRAQYSASQGNTAPVGSFPVNGYGLYDMAGNVWEWCWDWWNERWYRESEGSTPNTRGCRAGAQRVSRGGSWRSDPRFLRCAYRDKGVPSSISFVRGFRLAGGQVQAAQLDEGGERGSRDETPSEPPEESGAVRRSVRKRVKKAKRRRRA